MGDRLKAVIALGIGVALCTWFGWFHPWDWRAWAVIAVGAVVVSALSWLLKEYDGSNVKW